MSRPSSSATRGKKASPKGAAAALAATTVAANDAANEKLLREQEINSDEARALRASIASVLQQIQEERAQENLLSISRTFLQDQIEVSKAEKKTLDAELRELLQHKEENLVKNACELQIYKQKLTSLLSDQVSELHEQEIREIANTLRTKTSFLLGEEREKKRELTALHVYLRELEINHMYLMKDFELAHQKDIMELRQEFERKQTFLRANSLKLIKSKRDEIEAEKKNEITLLENKKAHFIANILFENKKAMDELKKYFSDIIHSHLEAIKNLKEEVGDMKKKEASLSKKISHIKKLNENLNVPLFQKQNLLVELKAQHQDYLNDKREIKDLHTELKSINANIDKLKWDKELFVQKIHLAKQETIKHSERHVHERFDFLQRSSFTQLIQRTEMKVYSQEVEKLEAAITEILLASEIEPESVGRVQGGLEALLKEKNSIILKLEDEIFAWQERLARAARGWNTQMKALALPPEELGASIKALEEVKLSS